MNRDYPEHINVQGCRMLHQFISFSTAMRVPGSRYHTDYPKHIPVRGCRMAIYAPGLAYGFLDHTTYVFHCAFMAGKTILLPTNIAMFPDIQ